jgi:hypothetical protein
MSRRRRPAPPSQGALSGWTILRAEAAGIGFGLAAFLLAQFAESRGAMLVYAGLLLLTMVCGASILLISLIDSHARQRGERVRPIRMFDLAMGALLVLPAGYGLYRIWPFLGL